MFDRIVVPLDGSPLAEKALPYAAFLAKSAGGKLFLVRAVETWGTTVHDGLEHEHEHRPRAEAELADAASKLASEGLAVEQALYPGEAAAAIQVAASTHDAGLIAMSTHGRGGLARWAYGSVTDRVLRHSSRPVLVIPAHSEVMWQAESQSTLVVPLDGSPLAEEALQPAILLARALRASIALLQVVEPPTLLLAGSEMGMGYSEPFDLLTWIDAARPYAEGVARRVEEETGLSVSAETTSGYASATIQEYAAARKAAAIVMASRGRTGIVRLALGSVASGVVQRATAPVLIMRPTAIEEAGASSNEPASG